MWKSTSFIVGIPLKTNKDSKKAEVEMLEEEVLNYLAALHDGAIKIHI